MVKFKVINQKKKSLLSAPQLSIIISYMASPEENVKLHSI